jgi:alpha-galactosidase
MLVTGFPAGPDKLKVFYTQWILSDIRFISGFIKIQSLNRKNLLTCFITIFCFACTDIYREAGKGSERIVPQKDKSLALKPPMGWNSWDCFGFDVNEAEVKATADFMAKNLKELGYEYVVLDMNWYAAEGPAGADIISPPYHLDQFGRLLPDTVKFPSSKGGRGFKSLADYIHSLGLKFGIHILGGIPKKAVDANCLIKGTSFHASSVTQPETGGYRYPTFQAIDLTKPGGQEYYNSIFELFAAWGVDYIKADYLPFDSELIGMSRASRTCGRGMIISAVPDQIPLHVLRENAHMFRVGLDLWDKWEWLKRSFFMAAIVVKEAEPGFWPDLDMLPVGMLTVKSPREGEKPHISNLTKDEVYTLFSLWYITRMPLMIGGYLPQTDPFTMSVIRNKEALEVNRNSTNNRQIYQFETDFFVWTADIPDSQDKYVAFFNISDKNYPIHIGVGWGQIGLQDSTYNVRDLWAKKDLGGFSERFSAPIPAHGAGLYKVSE